MTTQLKAKQPSEVMPGHAHGELFGKPGAGKTWFALTFPSPYYVDTEGGASLNHYMKRLQQSGGAYLGPEDGATDFPTVLGQVQALATEKHKYRTLVIDSITKIYQSCIAKEQEKFQDKYGDKSDYGSIKKPAIAYMRRLLNWVTRLDMNVWFVAHQTSAWGLVNGQREEIGIVPDIWDKVQHDLHLVLHVEQVNRNLRIATVTKSRLLGFPQFDRLTLQDGDNDMGYTEFAERYGRDYIEAEAKPIVLATPEQLAEITRLTGILKLGDDEVDKVLNKAGAESFSELDSDQALKFITWLNKKLNG